MDTLALYASYLRSDSNLHIPAQRDGDDGSPRAARSDTCPTWCRGHDGGKVGSHRSHTIEARVAGNTFPSRSVQVSVHAEHQPDGPAGDPWVSCDDLTMTPAQARRMADGLAMAATMADPDAPIALKPADVYAPHAVWRAVQATNAETVGALARMGAGELGKEILAIALRLKAMGQAVHLMQTDPNQLLAMQLWRCLVVDDLSAVDSPDTTIAELLGRRESLAKTAAEGLPEARRFRVETSLGSLEYRTSSRCESWCLSGDPQICDGYCMSAEDVVVASAAGGRFDGDFMRFPVAVVYSSISYPQGLAGVQLVPRGPYAAKGTLQGWLELLPDEAYQLADALRHHADPVAGKDHSC